MKNKTLLNVRLPITGKHYDFWVPGDMCMQDATMLIAEAMQNIEPDYYEATAHAALMLAATGQIQHPGATVSQIGLVDGTEFVLV